MFALQDVRRGKAKRKDGIVTDLLIDAGDKFHKRLIQLFTL